MRHRLEYAAVRTVAALVARLPMRTVRALGAGLGRLAFWADARHRRITLDNLAAAFPERDVRERQALARATFAHFGSLLLEILKFGSYSPAEMLAAVELDGAAVVAEAEQKGRGIIFVTGHFGYWEMQATVHALNGHPVALLARRLDNPLLHDLLERLRTRTGASVIYRQGAVRRMLRELAANHSIAVLIDQHLQTDVVTVNFFGRPAATTAAVASLALRTGAAVIPVFALPLPHGRYRLVFEQPVAAPPATDAAAVQTFTQRCTDVLERYVRQYPSQWLWMHRRWRVAADAVTAPAGGPMMRVRP